jgi:stalled ribosome rescue protein Dom34
MHFDSPGFLADDFRKFCLAVAIQQEDREMVTCVDRKFITCHASCGYRSAVDEILKNADLQSRMNHMKVFGQMSILSQFHDILRDDENRVCYGLAEVEYAQGLEAIKDLLITDTLYHVNDPEKRNR